MNAHHLRLYLVSDDELCPLARLLELLPGLIDAGVSTVQLRDKRGSTRAMVQAARRLKACLEPHGVPLIVNDRADVALASGADGVHLGSDDLDPPTARRILGPGALLGMSVTGPEAMAAVGDEVDYVAIGPVYTTPTKADAGPPVGLDGLRELRAMTARPVVAIGGIGLEQAPSVLGTGVDGIAVVSSILGMPDPVAAAHGLCASVRSGAGSP